MWEGKTESNERTNKTDRLRHRQPHGGHQREEGQRGGSKAHRGQKETAGDLVTEGDPTLGGERTVR